MAGIFIIKSANNERKEVSMAEQDYPIQGAIPEKRSYSVTEAAEILGVSKRSVYNLCASGAFWSVRVGSKLRISKKSFDEWLDGNQ